MGSAASTLSLSEDELMKEIRELSTGAPDKFALLLKLMLQCKAEQQMAAVFSPAAAQRTVSSSKGGAGGSVGNTFAFSSREPVSVSLEIAEEVSLLRSDPAAYAQHLVTHLSNFVTEKDYIIDDPKYRYETSEGKAAVQEAIDVLRGTKPLSVVQPNNLLEKAAADHVADMATHSGLSGHTGSDGSESHERISRYGTYEVTCGENIDYGMNSARSIIIHLLVDDGVANRGHRKNLLEERFTLVGASFGFHSEYRCCCVMDFAGGMKDFADMVLQDVCVECPAGQMLPNTVFKIFHSFSSEDSAKKLIATCLERLGTGDSLNIDYKYSDKVCLLDFTRQNGDRERMTYTWG